MELVVVADEVPVPVTEQVAEPAAVKAPAGNVRVHATCVPETVPDNVPLIFCKASPSSSVMPNAPVGLVPLWVAVHVTAFRSLLLEPRLPAHVPARLSPDGAVGDSEFEPHPDARTAATSSASAEN